MEFFRLYLVRCITCNNSLGHLKWTYETLLSTGQTIEEALNGIGLSNYCCRMCMMNPIICTYNMENRQAIEGFVPVDAVDTPSPYDSSTVHPIFSHCLADPRVAREQLLAGVPGQVLVQAPTTPETQGLQIQPEVKPFGRAIQVPDMEPEVFKEPNVPGMPEINIDTKNPEQTMHVGGGSIVKILNGRTYLAR